MERMHNKLVTVHRW